MKFCEKLRLKRTQAHMTQEELAKRLGLAKRTVEGYESGAFSPRRRDVYALLAQIFATDPGYFVTDDENEVPAEELARQVRRVPMAKVNLIPLSPVDHRPDFKTPSDETMLMFLDVLMKHRVQTMLRRSRGKDANAACGQLRLHHLGA